MKKFLSILLVLIVICSCLVFVGCNQKADNTKYYNAITKKCALTKDYAGKSFMADGIGTAVVDSYTDGDTTRFKTGDETIVIRYYCVDTPESTGSIQKWGKAASNFVKDRLSQATEIVLESSTGTRPEHDSYGSRYLAYVWYKTSDHDFRLLNLELIENGFTNYTGLNTDAYPYASYMVDAEKFARSIELRVYSKLDDPLFSDKPIEMSIKDFLDNNELYYSEETDSGSKIMMDAYLESVLVSDSGTYTFTAAQYDPETKAIYRIPVYTGYISSEASSMKLGHMYKIIGTVQNYYGKFQISGVTFSSFYESTPAYQKKLEGTFIIQDNYYLTFNSSTEYTDHCSNTYYEDLTISTVSVENNVLTIVGSARKMIRGGLSEDSFEFTIQVNVADGYETTLMTGDKIRFSGYRLNSESDIITVPRILDISKK